MADPSNFDCSDDTQANSSEPKPLEGQTIVVTRAVEQADSLCTRLAKLGAKTLVHPVIRILPPDSVLELDRCISRIDEFDWLVFVSTNSVRFFVDRFVAIHGSTDLMKRKKTAVIGQATAAFFTQQCNRDVDLIPVDSNSQALGNALEANAQGQKLLIARADRGTQTLSRVLSAAAIDFEEVVAYRSCDVDSADPEIAKRLIEGSVDWVTITSGAIARSAVRIFGKDLSNSKLVSISPATSEVLVELGFVPDAEAEIYNMDGIVDAILRFVAPDS